MHRTTTVDVSGADTDDTATGKSVKIKSKHFVVVACDDPEEHEYWYSNVCKMDDDV